LGPRVLERTRGEEANANEAREEIQAIGKRIHAG
jgi:hypothetical protein